MTKAFLLAKLYIVSAATPPQKAPLNRQRTIAAMCLAPETVHRVVGATGLSTFTNQETPTRERLKFSGVMLKRGIKFGTDHK